MRKTRLPVSLKLATWIMTDRASQMNRPPMMREVTSVLVRTASDAKAAPRASEPVSPMKIEAG